jgi:hypothetical protein
MNQLVVPPPPAGVIRLRFTNSSTGIFAKLIRWRTMGDVSHVEAVLPDGRIIAALAGEGVVAKPANYDTTSTSQIIVDIIGWPGEVAAWIRYLESRLGRPYDWETIAGLALHTGWRMKGGMICSMLQALALREAHVFDRPLSEPAHEITPRDLLLILSAFPGTKIVKETL